MGNPKWYNTIINHLVDYKTNVLHIEGDGEYKNNQTWHPHILPGGKEEDNYMSVAISKKLPKKYRHPNFYHLNSSQTLCVNFFAPLMDNKEYLQKIMKIITGKDIEVEKCELEKKITNEYSRFDFWVSDSSGAQYFFEIKYLEKGLTKKTSSKKIIDYYNECYKTDIDRNEYFINLKGCIDDYMTKYFQTYRVMVKSYDNNYAIFNTLKSNSSTEKAYYDAYRHLGVETTPRIIHIHWENLLEDIITTIDDVNLRNHYLEMKKKYIPNHN